jgi:hypothetical protein
MTFDCQPKVVGLADARQKQPQASGFSAFKPNGFNKAKSLVISQVAQAFLPANAAPGL